MLTEHNFTEVVGTEEFLNLGMEQVSSLITSDKLTIPSEEKVNSPAPWSSEPILQTEPGLKHVCVSGKVFEAVIAWVNHDKDVRQEHLAHLMEHVRLPLLSREYLVQVCYAASCCQS